MRKYKWLLAAFTALALAGCSLARPEAEPVDEADMWGDRFIGFYVVQEDGEDSRSGFYNNPYLEEYGSSSVEAGGLGSLDLPREVLFASEKYGQYSFPGLKGYSLFLLNGTTEDGSTYSKAVTNMGPGADGSQVMVTDTGTALTISGTIYIGPPLGAENWDVYMDNSIWNIYRVFQTPDGRPYLDGSGNSCGGFFGTYTETQTYSSAQNGETTKEDSIQVTVSMEVYPRLERLVVTEFNAENAIVYSGDVIRDALPEIHCEAETAWVLVEEYSKDGVVRTAYNVPGEGEEPISHQIILLDDAGLGHLEYLHIS